MSGEQREPKGFGEHARGPAAERAHEQGWDLNEEARTQLPTGPQNTYGGSDYDYGAQDFGDDPVNRNTTEEQMAKVREALEKE